MLNVEQVKLDLIGKVGYESGAIVDMGRGLT